jgi:hypothetical protein
MSYKHSFHTQTSSTFPVFQEEGRLTRPRRKRRLPRQEKKFFSTHIRRFTPETCSFVSLRLVYFSPYFLIFRFGEMELPLENLLQQWKEPQRFTILHEETSNLEEDECSRKQPKEPKAVKQPTVVRSPILKRPLTCHLQREQTSPLCSAVPITDASTSERRHNITRLILQVTDLLLLSYLFKSPGN